MLLSLVNQTLVQQEASRRGISVPEEELARALDAMRETELLAQALPDDDDDSAFVARVRVFLLFGLVKSAVVGRVEIPQEQFEKEYSADPNLWSIPFADAIPALRERLIGEVSNRRWVDWLSRQRACADIRILDVSFDVPSSTPGIGCGASNEP